MSTASEYYDFLLKQRKIEIKRQQAQLERDLAQAKHSAMISAITSCSGIFTSIVVGAAWAGVDITKEIK